MLLQEKNSTVAAEGQQSRADAVIEGLFSRADRAFLSSAISREEGEFLRNLCARPDVTNTVEIGCGNGISTIYICSGISNKSNPNHTAIDPFQSSEFRGQGVENVAAAGFDFFRLIEQPSETALPALLAEGGHHYDLALIDGLHTADQTMVDFYFIDRMLRVGGILVFDDVNGPAVNKVVRYASTYPNYRLLAMTGRRGTPRRIVNVIKQALSICLWPARKFSEAICREFIDVSVVLPEHLWTFDFHSMLALEKTGEYARDTNWYEGL